MSVEDFDVDAAKVRGDYFPTRNAFSAESTPSTSTVSGFIIEEAGRLAGLLKTQDIEASTITASVTYGTASTWTAAYVWCRKYVTLATAIRVLSCSTEGAADSNSKWRDWLVAMETELKDNGASILGDDSLDGSTGGPHAASSHISELGLDVGDEETDTSDAIHVFRKSDQL